MLSASAVLQDLSRQMAKALSSLSSLRDPIGRPELVMKAAAQSEELFHGYTKGRPSKQDAYASALAFMEGESLNDVQRHLLGAALCVSIGEFRGQRPLEHPKLSLLLKSYEREAEAGDLWRMTWFGLLCSYFEFDPLTATEPQTIGWKELRAFLQRTWPYVDAESGRSLVPDWMKVLRDDPGLLTEHAARRYALAFLGGDDSLEKLASDLGVPESSWFWHALVLGAVHLSIEQSDEKFKDGLPKLISLLKQRPAFRDAALEALLTRYHQCKTAPVHEQLRGYAVRKDVWRNPKLRAAGIATAWNRVSDAVWQMALNWVNEHNLRAFFEILATRNSADEGRLAFWSRYLDQISWTRLIFSSETMALARRNAGIRELLAGEEGAYATLWGNRSLDAFLMQIGDYVVVEFSTNGNAAYVYKSDWLKFDRHAPQYHGGTDDLRYGFHGGSALRIIHNSGWEGATEHALKGLGIYPDRTGTGATNRSSPRIAASPGGSAPSVSATQTVWTSPKPPPAKSAAGAKQVGDEAPLGARFTMEELRAAVSTQPGAVINDLRAKDRSGGRLWIRDPAQSLPFGKLLMEWGFRWSGQREAFYYPES